MNFYLPHDFIGQYSIVKCSKKHVYLMLAFIGILGLCSCATPIVPGAPTGVPGQSGLPTPVPIPGGGTGIPDEGSNLPPPLPGPQSKQGSGSSNSGSEKQSAESSKGNTESEGQSADADELPEGWEQDEDELSERQDSDDLTFEEPEKEVTVDGFEQPNFEEQGGLSEQELEELEKELDETLGDFDEEIEREKTFAEERANDNINENDEVAFEEYDESQGRGETDKRSPSVSSDTTQSGQQGNASSSAGAGGESSKGGENRQGSSDAADPENRDDSNAPDLNELSKNDDIVARQIREAAEAEVDPELKKSLWEEYYRYKGL